MGWFTWSPSHLNNMCALWPLLCWLLVSSLEAPSVRMAWPTSRTTSTCLATTRRWTISSVPLQTGRLNGSQVTPHVWVCAHICGLFVEPWIAHLLASVVFSWKNAMGSMENCFGEMAWAPWCVSTITFMNSWKSWPDCVQGLGARKSNGFHGNYGPNGTHMDQTVKTSARIASGKLRPSGFCISLTQIS
jgi:hypothetical protein